MQKNSNYNVEIYGISHHVSRWEEDEWVDLFEMYKQSIPFPQRTKKSVYYHLAVREQRSHF